MGMNARKKFFFNEILLIILALIILPFIRNKDDNINIDNQEKTLDNLYFNNRQILKAEKSYIGPEDVYPGIVYSKWVNINQGNYLYICHGKNKEWVGEEYYPYKPDTLDYYVKLDDETVNNILDDIDAIMSEDGYYGKEQDKYYIKRLMSIKFVKEEDLEKIFKKYGIDINEFCKY